MQIVNNPLPQSERGYFPISTVMFLLGALYLSFFFGCGGSDVRQDKTVMAPPEPSHNGQPGPDERKPWNEEVANLADLDAKVRKVGAYFDDQVGSLRSDLDALKKNLTQPSPASAAPTDQEKETVVAATAVTPLPEGPPLTPRQVQSVYASGMSFYQKGDYEQAARIFSQIAGQAPKDKLAPNSLYWLGECFYSREKYREAIQEFKRTAELYPNSPKAPDATLKIAYSHSRLGSGPEAMIALRDLLFKYPKSSAARMVREGKTIFPNH